MGEIYIGYHGTTISGADSILSSRQFRFSIKEEEWLGKGVYFFEKDIQQAVNYCVKAKGRKEYSILKSEIEPNICIDLDSTDEMKIMDGIAKSINNRYKKLKDGRERKLKNSVILDKLYKLKPYDVVKKTFFVEKTNPIKDTNFVLVQVQICVRNQACIKTIEEVIRHDGS